MKLSNQKNKKMKVVRLIIAISISIIISYLLLSKINFSHFLSLYEKINFRILILLIPIYYISIGLKTLRFNYILKTSISYKKLFRIVILHNFFINFLPFRLGEVSYLYLLKKEKVYFGKNLSSLLKVRLLDFLLLSTAFFIFSFLFNDYMEKFYWKNIIKYFLLAITLIVTLFYVLRVKAITFFSFLNERVKRKLLKMIIRKLIETLDNLNFETIKEFFISLFYLLYIVFFYALNINYLTISTIIIGISIIQLTTLIPVSGFLNIGTFEGFWYLVFTILGLQEKDAISSGYLIHVIYILLIIFTTLFFLGINKKTGI